jgi:hypothetical protein
MGLFAKGDVHYSQGQRPWMDAQRAVFANGDIQPVGGPVVVHTPARQLFSTINAIASVRLNMAFGQTCSGGIFQGRCPWLC